MVVTFRLKPTSDRGGAAHWNALGRLEARDREALSVEVEAVEARGESAEEEPGTERGDEEELLFVASLTEAERAFWIGHRGLGNSQKAEVAWLEQQGYEYEEREVRSFLLDRQRSSKALRVSNKGTARAIAGQLTLEDAEQARQLAHRRRWC